MKQHFDCLNHLKGADGLAFFCLLEPFGTPLEDYVSALWQFAASQVVTQVGGSAHGVIRVYAFSYVMYERAFGGALQLGGCVGWSLKVTTRRGFTEQIVAPGNSQTVPTCQWLSPMDIEFIDELLRLQHTESDLGSELPFALWTTVPRHGASPSCEPPWIDNMLLPDRAEAKEKQ